MGSSGLGLGEISLVGWAFLALAILGVWVCFLFV